MKKSIFAFGLLATFALFSFGIAIDSASVNTERSVINWKGYKVTGEHSGTINLQNGELKFENDVLVGGGFEIDMRSMKVTDIEGEWAQKLEGHLKSGDFFGVDKYPVAKFVVTKAVSKGTPGDYKVIGNLTIKETTKEIRFYAHLNEDRKSASADITIDRTDFDVRYGSGSFFENLGDKTIYDEFELNVNLVVD
ncbi:MAG: YceI family protein [Bacteroidetes bacterium]|jgi:polyisoprenoid-binding protein YceI|nr:YceI family protein [Bacteroidota bacterium]MDF1865903.1 YceI family protein [Saprospiraceae bacterium]